MKSAFRRRRQAARLLTAAALVAAVTLGAAAWRRAHAPRAWEPSEVEVAFWAWRDQTPAQEDVDRAVAETGARTLFLRAGQFDHARGKVTRVRAVAGEFPENVALHLVYNATPALLSDFEGVGERALAASAAETFREDSGRAAREGSRVAGLQLDIDVPTRLLARYGRVLAETRALLPAGARLSVTGLPTWMNSPRELRAALAAADFWVPQFYGAEIPQSLERVVPISSASAVRGGAERARELGKPFYAGLAAYGHAMLYSPRGRLVELRGDLDPARVVSERSLELVERRAFEPAAARGGAPSSGWRYVFRAQAEAVLDGLVLKAGDTLVLDVPSGEQLRASARGVREQAGGKLLGLCLFRLPTRGDPTTLALGEIATALRDREAEVSTRLAAEAPRAGEGPAERLLLTAVNTGPAAALYGDDALSVTVKLPPGALRGVTRLEGFDACETLCAPARAGAEAGGAGGVALRPCAPARAGYLRLRARGWPAGAKARVGLSFERAAPAELEARVAVRADDGRLREQAWSLRTLATNETEEQEGR